MIRQALFTLAMACIISSADSASASTVAHWRFQEGPLGANVPAGSGGEAEFDNTVLDSSGNGNHLRTWAGFSSPLYVSDVPFGTAPQTGDPNPLR